MDAPEDDGYEILDDDETEQLPEALKHSGLGIASFVLSLVSALMVVLIVAVVVVMIDQGCDDFEDEESLAVITVGLAIMFFGAGTLVSLGLGIAGLRQTNRKKSFAIAGTVFAALTVLGIGGLCVLGMLPDEEEDDAALPVREQEVCRRPPTLLQREC